MLFCTSMRPSLNFYSDKEGEGGGKMRERRIVKIKLGNEIIELFNVEQRKLLILYLPNQKTGNHCLKLKRL